MIKRSLSYLRHQFCGEYASYSPQIIAGSWSQAFPRAFLLLLQMTAFATLAGRGWLTYRFDSKIRAFFWDEELMTPILEGWFSIDWEYHHAHSYQWIDPTIKGIGIFLLACSIVPFLVKLPKCRWLLALLFPATLVLMVENYAIYYDTHETFGMLVEHSLQAVAPIALVWFYLSREKLQWWAYTISVAAALTFIGHGLYAVGYYPVPAHYQTMTMELLALSEVGAKSFLVLMGYLDFAAAAAIFIPCIRRLGLIYMILWGGCTALARLLTMFEPAQQWYGLDEAVGETLVRTSHWALPLVLFALLPMWKKNKGSDS